MVVQSGKQQAKPSNSPTIPVLNAAGSRTVGSSTNLVPTITLDRYDHTPAAHQYAAAPMLRPLSPVRLSSSVIRERAGGSISPPSRSVSSSPEYVIEESMSSQWN